MARNPAEGPGSSAPVYAYASGTTVRDNGATVLMGGNIDTSSTVTNAPDLAITGAGRRAQPKPVESAYNGTTNGNSDGTFAVLAAGQYVVKGGNVTTVLANVAYRGLRGAGNQMQNRSIHSLLTRGTVIITAWDYATGVATKSANSDDNFGTVNGTHTLPTRALPGNVVITDFDGLEPTVVALPAKTG